VNKITKDLLNVMGHFTGPEFILKACTVKTEDYQRVKLENIHLRRAAAICVNFCCGTPLPPETSDPDLQYPQVGFYFDRNEPYLDTLYSSWVRHRKRPKWGRQIQEIRAVNAGDCPGIQAADVVAWLSNGFHSGDTRATPLFPIFLALSGGMHKFYDYESIKGDYGNDRRGVDPLSRKGMER
jgi:hypothetical protein